MANGKQTMTIRSVWRKFTVNIYRRFSFFLRNFGNIDNENEIKISSCHLNVFEKSARTKFSVLVRYTTNNNFFNSKFQQYAKFHEYGNESAFSPFSLFGLVFFLLFIRRNYYRTLWAKFADDDLFIESHGTMWILYQPDISINAKHFKWLQI